MCGIAGVIDLRGGAVAPREILAMSRAIHHRGPDDGGFTFIDQNQRCISTFSDVSSPESVRCHIPVLDAGTSMPASNIALAHRRFSIIDLSDGGHQPYIDKEESCCLVFNGEIYNHIELRAELEARGVVFRTHSDTEVLLESYKAWGTECFTKLAGFWALALYDRRNNQLILSRDHLGKKPLYWAKVGSRIWFASEIKALLQIPQLAARKKVNEQAIWHWCTFGQRDLGLSTFFSGIQSLQPGCWVVPDDAFPDGATHYWQPPRDRLTEDDISIGEATGELYDTLSNAVRLRLRADVPLALELSGGMDSSAILALAAENHSDKLTTFTVKYSDPRYNEEPFARAVAQRYNVDYRVVELPTDTFWHSILPVVYLEEEPFHSPNLHTSQTIWSTMRSEGIKVSLTGAAGDELLAGYDRYFWHAQRDNLDNGRYWRFLDNAARWTERLPGHYTQLFKDFLKPLRHAAGWRYKPEYLSPNVGSGYLKKMTPPGELALPNSLTEMLYSDVTNTLIPYWLRSGDKGQMSVPFEARCPFLDQRVVELAMRLPETYLVRHGWHKWILRKTFEQHLPSEVVWRKQKMGFPFPYETFYRDHADIIAHILDNADNPFIDFSKKDLLRTDWHGISFILWYELFFNDNLDLFGHISDMIQSKSKGPDWGYMPEFLNTCRPS